MFGVTAYECLYVPIRSVYAYMCLYVCLFEHNLPICYMLLPGGAKRSVTSPLL
jgi:hypothetical protein